MKFTEKLLFSYKFDNELLYSLCKSVLLYEYLAIICHFLYLYIYMQRNIKIIFVIYTLCLYYFIIFNFKQALTTALLHVWNWKKK